jgi:outer membrane receptor protein involved in Fe transport
MNKKPLTGPVVSKAKGSATVRRGLVLVSILLPAVSWAQAQAQGQGQAQGPTEQIIVTGTRLPDPNLGSTSPIQVVSAQEIAISGKNDAVDILMMLPQAFTNDLGQDLGNRTSGLTTAGGVATADLRGLGPNRTLVLVNGRRLGTGSPYTIIQSPAPDLDQIPSRLIERVEVVTGGASAVYGSDAVAGVVNFITRKDFEGIEFEATSGFNWHDNSSSLPQSLAADAGFDIPSGTHTDGHTSSYNLIAGANSGDGRGNFTVYLGYQTQDGVRSDQRDYGAGQLFTDTDANGVPTGDVFMSGSSNSNRFQPKSGPLGTTPTAVFSVLGNQFVPYGSADTTPPAVFNSQKDIYMTRQYNRYNAGLIGHYDLNDHVQPYVEFGFMNDKTHQQIAPSALFRQSNPLTADGNYLINCSNPLLSTQQKNILCSAAQIATDTANPGTASASVEIGRRNIEGGGRTSDYEHTNYRGVAGVRGEIGPAWRYDAYGQYYYVQFYNSNDQYLNFDRITNALQVKTDAGGNPVCISGPPCVPYNVFADGGVTQSALNYLYTAGTGYGTDTLRTVHADFTGDLGEYGVKVPSARQGLSINVGYETREEHQNFKPDEAELSGLLSGFGGAAVAIDESIDVNEYFAEVRVPLVQDKKGAADLSIDAGYRTSDYSTSGTADTWKFEVQYAPVNSTRLRASVNRAIRAPSIIELFNPQNVGKITIGADPCAPTFDANFNVVSAVNTLQECLRTVAPSQAAAFTAAYGNGGTTNQIPQGTANQLSQLQGGNTLLQPETADTYSIGVSLTPDRLQRFTASVDYWHIKIEDQVGTLPAGVSLNGCPDTGDPVFCSQLSRQPQTFTLDGASVAGGGYIIQTSQNIAASETSGIDVQGNYRLDFQSRGSLNLALAASYMLSQETTPYPGAHTYDCTGLFGLTCQTVNPVWRHVLRATWQTPSRVSVTASWRYIAEVKEDNNDSDPTLNNASFAGFDSFNAKIGAQNYFDLAATYSIKKIELRAGINNITDKAPPFLGSEIVGGGSPNTYGTYDIFGRQVFFAVNVRL